MIPKVIHKVMIIDGYELPNEFPPLWKNAISSWKEINPEYTLKIYSGADCREYILKNYDEKTLGYFDKLKPYSYKCDLFRFLVLYKEGGWYSDMRQVCLQSINKLNNLGREFYASIDCPPNERCMYTAFIGSVANHPILYKTIERVKWNIDHLHYGIDCLYPTGPGAFMEGSVDYVRQFPDKCFIGKHIVSQDRSEYIIFNNTPFIKCKYNNAKGADNTDIKGGNDYGEMWRNWDVYLKK